MPYVRSTHRAGFTLIEMLTTVAGLVIVLGLMVSLARYVRSQSAGAITKRLMVKLDALVRDYERSHGRVPDVPPLITEHSSLEETAIQFAAIENNRAIVLALSKIHELGDLPISPGPDGTLRDRWGTPLVFMPPGAANIRTSPQPRAFFMSAGPDRKFLTREDNLYSYEVLTEP